MLGEYDLEVVGDQRGPDLVAEGRGQPQPETAVAIAASLELHWNAGSTVTRCSPPNFYSVDAHALVEATTRCCLRSADVSGTPCFSK